MKIALLAGFPRSGTTLLEQTLAAHPGVVGTDESGVLATQFVDPLVHRAASTADAIVELRGFDADQLAAGRRAYRDCTEAHLGEPVGGRWLVEKDPLLTADLPVPLRLFPECRLILPLRDPRDVLVSFLFTMVPLGAAGAAAVGPAEAARFYHDVLRHWPLFRDRLDRPWVETRYEDMTADGPAETARVLRFLGLDPAPDPPDAARRAAATGPRAVSTPSHEDVARPLYRRGVGRWRNYERHLAPALPTLTPWVKAFGYG